MDMALGLNLMTITRADLRVRPKDASIIEEEIESELDRRQSARAEKVFATSDAILDALAAKGVEVMDGDPLRWEWAIPLGLSLGAKGGLTVSAPLQIVATSTKTGRASCRERVGPHV